MSSIGKNISYQIAYQVLTILTPLITSPIISRAFGAAGMGLYSATIAYVTYFTLFAMLGVGQYGNRTIAAYQNNIIKRSELFWSIYSVQFCSAACAIIVYFFSLHYIAQSRWTLALIQSLWIFSYLVDINWFFFGMEQFKITVTRNFIIKFFTVLSIAVFIRTPDDLYLYAIIMGGGALLGQLALWGYLRRFVVLIKPEWNEIKNHIFPILKLFIPVVALSVFHLMDKSMLDWLSTEENVGYYYSADKVINIPLGLTTAVNSVMLPRIANILHENAIDSIGVLLTKSIELTIILVCGVSFGIAAIAQEFVPVFFGPGYEACVLLIYWFVPVLIIKTLESTICSQYIVPAHKDNLYIASVFGGAFANVLSNYFLIKKFAALGAVLGTLTAEFVVLLILLIYVKEISFLKYFLKQFHYVLFGSVMFVVVRVISSLLLLTDWLKLVLLIVVGVIVYSSCCLIWCFFNKNSVIYTVLLSIYRKVF